MGVLCRKSNTRRWNVEKWHVSVASVVILLEPIEIRPKLSYKVMTEILGMGSTFCWDADYSDICAGSLEAAHQTTVQLLPTSRHLHSSNASPNTAEVRVTKCELVGCDPQNILDLPMDCMVWVLAGD